MAEETPRLGLNIYEFGDVEWDHTDAVKAIDKYSLLTGRITERPAEGSYDDELYLATDQRILWKWSENDGDWLAVAGFGSIDAPVPNRSHFEGLQAENVNNVRVAEDGDTLQGTINHIDDGRWRDEYGVVALKPNTTYYIDDEIFVKENTTIWSNNAVIKPTSDTNVLFMDTATRIFGPLTINTLGVNGYSSNAIEINGGRSTSDWYRALGDRHFRIDGPVTLRGNTGEGTGLYLRSESENYITHCSATIDLEGFDVGVHADTTAGGFVNDIHLNYEATHCNTAILTEGSNGGKLLVYGHLQLGQMKYGIRNINSDYGPMFFGHLEDPHWVEGGAAVSGDKITVVDPYSRVNLENQSWDIGTGTTINGFGKQTTSNSNQRTPTASAYATGDTVRFINKSTPSYDGIYLKDLNNGWIKLNTNA